MDPITWCYTKLQILYIAIPYVLTWLQHLIYSFAVQINHFIELSVLHSPTVSFWSSKHNRNKTYWYVPHCFQLCVLNAKMQIRSTQNDIWCEYYIAKTCLFCCLFWLAVQLWYSKNIATIQKNKKKKRDICPSLSHAFDLK